MTTPRFPTHSQCCPQNKTIWPPSNLHGPNSWKLQWTPFPPHLSDAPATPLALSICSTSLNFFLCFFSLLCFCASILLCEHHWCTLYIILSLHYTVSFPPMQMYVKSVDHHDKQQFCANRMTEPLFLKSLKLHLSPKFLRLIGSCLLVSWILMVLDAYDLGSQSIWTFNFLLSSTIWQKFPCATIHSIPQAAAWLLTTLEQLYPNINILKSNFQFLFLIISSFLFFSLLNFRVHFLKIIVTHINFPERNAFCMVVFDAKSCDLQESKSSMALESHFPLFLDLFLSPCRILFISVNSGIVTMILHVLFGNFALCSLGLRYELFRVFYQYSIFPKWNF